MNFVRSNSILWSQNCSTKNELVNNFQYDFRFMNLKTSIDLIWSDEHNPDDVPSIYARLDFVKNKDQSTSILIIELNNRFLPIKMLDIDTILATLDEIQPTEENNLKIIEEKQSIPIHVRLNNVQLSVEVRITKQYRWWIFLNIHEDVWEIFENGYIGRNETTNENSSRTSPCSSTSRWTTSRSISTCQW